MDDGVATSAQQDLRHRLGRAVRIWREATDAPLPRLDPDAPDRQVAALEMEVVELLADQADPRRAADLQFQLAELMEDRPSDDPISRRARAIRLVLLDLDERRSGSRGRPLRPPGES
ncbi:MAG: soluble NSF attachment family protein [Actinomycetota bacterium]|nr:soluble NSF attachment family protein [Actinomycetota bacterium]